MGLINLANFTIGSIMFTVGSLALAIVICIVSTLRKWKRFVKDVWVGLNRTK